MTYIPYLEGPFFDALESGADYATVEKTLLELTAPLGVVSVSCTDVRPSMLKQPRIGCLLGKQDTEYVMRYRAERFAERDVTIMRVFRTRQAFSWDDARPMIDDIEKEEVFGAAAEHGYHDGWIVPHHGVGLGIGVTSFMGEELCDRPGTRRLLTHVGSEFYRYARALAIREGQLGEMPPPPSLTPRQKELCYLISQGMTDKQMARELDIAVKTVNHHMEALRKKFDASTRTELFAKVLHYSQTDQLMV